MEDNTGQCSAIAANNADPRARAKALSTNELDPLGDPLRDLIGSAVEKLQNTVPAQG